MKWRSLLAEELQRVGGSQSAEEEDGKGESGKRSEANCRTAEATDQKVVKRF